MERIICVLIGYAFGLFQTGYIYGKAHNIDIRSQGSGNAGTTNALRTLGWKAGVATLLGDAFKCVFAVLTVQAIYRNSRGDILPLLSMYAGMGAVLGHNYPFYLEFKGGKRHCGDGRPSLEHDPMVDGTDLPVCVCGACGGYKICVGRIFGGRYRLSD